MSAHVHPAGWGTLHPGAPARSARAPSQGRVLRHQCTALGASGAAVVSHGWPLWAALATIAAAAQVSGGGPAAWAPLASWTMHLSP